ncbi:helix-turn-helix transcriptional regulator [Numidum massiliense]|uniref:helix-turn-helix transcriptional regulator n=1 Tax=Numidum massiliense TaxID=1522315 RepID=UPI0006D56251|nr:helix-turn-helix transcriptional regulator [Numidum massiliense]
MQGATVRKIRHLHGLTQQEAAELLGVSRAAVQQIETERLAMSDRLRQRFREVFDVDDEMLAFLERF